MTLFYNDLSSYDAGFVIPAGTSIVVAKATEGTYYMDKSYHDFEFQAKRLGATFSGYHFLKQESSPEAQAAWYYGFAGKTPCMLDVETEGGSNPGVDYVLRFMKALTALGGRVWGVYYPKWYWGRTGGNLGSVVAAGAVIISSTGDISYTDTGDGWMSYGGATPRIWQFTDKPHDTNAFKGTAEELSAIITGDDMTPADVWGYKNPTLDNEDMRKYLVDVYNMVVALTAKVNALSVTTLDPKAVADAELAEIKVKL